MDAGSDCKMGKAYIGVSTGKRKAYIGVLIRYRILVFFFEDFESEWFIDNPFPSLLLTEDFESEWFIDNPFPSLLFTEDFEDGGW